jgi:signal transduction histidine kinase
MKTGIRLKVIVLLVGIYISIFLLMSIGGIQTIGGNFPRESGRNIILIITSLTGIFLICAILLTWLITKKILKPLKELNSATKSIMEGDLDFEIDYKNKDEMGRFCTAFQLMTYHLKESLEKQAAYENSRNELIASISHDLRTPMSSIKGYVEGLQDGIVHDNKKKRDRLIDDLFLFSQFELKNLGMDLEQHDSQKMLREILNVIEMEFIDSRISLSIKEIFLSIPVKADKIRIEQVFENIISNAKRYIEDDGKITIRITNEGSFLLIAIQDTGTGIASEDLPHIFDRFYRGEKSRSREFGGAGFGLAICKQIVEDHGGSIWVDSKIGEGTTFFFT